MVLSGCAELMVVMTELTVVSEHHLFRAFSDSQNEIDDDSSQQGDRQHSWAETVVEAALALEPDTPCSPVECGQGVNHGGHGDEGEQTCTVLSNSVTEIEETNSKASENDGEVEP